MTHNAPEKIKRENPAKLKHGANTLGPSYLQGHPLGRFGSIEVAKRPKKVRIEYQGVDSRTSFESTQIVQSKCTAPLVHLLLGLAMQQTPELGSSKAAAKVLARASGTQRRIAVSDFYFKPWVRSFRS
jgi:hypothetical protein